MTVRERIRHRLVPWWYPALQADLDALRRHRLGMDEPDDPNGIASIGEWGANGEPASPDDLRR